MRNLPDSYVSRVLFAMRSWDVVAQRHHQLTTSLFEPLSPGTTLTSVRRTGQKWQCTPHRVRG